MEADMEMNEDYHSPLSTASSVHPVTVDKDTSDQREVISADKLNDLFEESASPAMEPRGEDSEALSTSLDSDIEHMNHNDMISDAPELTENAEDHAAVYERISYVLGPLYSPLSDPKSMFLRLPKIFKYSLKEYDPKTLSENQIKRFEDEDLDSAAEMITHVIRWRRTTQSDGTESIESNASIVEWSNGDRSIFLGGQVYDLVAHSMVDENVYLYGVHVDDGVPEDIGKINQRHVLKLVTTIKTSRSGNKKWNKSLVASKVKMAVCTQDPERAIQALERTEAEKQKMLKKMDAKGKLFDRQRANRPLRELSKDFLEEEDEDDLYDSRVTGNNGVSKTSVVSGSRVKPRRRQYSEEDQDTYDEDFIDDEEASGEEDEDDDDEEEEDDDDDNDESNSDPDYEEPKLSKGKRRGSSSTLEKVKRKASAAISDMDE